MRNSTIINCTANYNYQSGFHMESYPIKENIKIIGCTAIGNGTGTASQTIASGFSCVCEGTTLVNCYAKNNKLRDYNMHGNTVRIQNSHGEIINCYENDMLISWNKHLADELYASTNLIPNGDFKYGTMFYDFLWRSYSLGLYKTPSFMRKKYNDTSVCSVSENKTTSLTLGTTAPRYIYGDFVTGIFHLDPLKQYTFSIDLDSSQNTALATLGIILTRYNWVSNTNGSLNTAAEVISFGTVLWTHNDANITTYSVTVGNGGTVGLTTAGYYNFAFDNAADLSTDTINRIYGIRLIENTLYGTATWNPGSLNDGVGETSAGITVLGASLGDYVLVAAPYDLQGITCNGYVSATNAVKIRLQNETGGTIDLASGTWKVKVIK
jgi:hypothetical protein